MKNNQLEKLQKELKIQKIKIQKIENQINKLQNKKCKHEYIEQWKDELGIKIVCLLCNKWLRSD